MTAVAVTGAAGEVGRRVVRRLVEDETFDEVRAFDRVAMIPPAGADFHQVDVRTGSEDLFVGCDSVVHLAEDPAHRDDVEVAILTLKSVLQRAEHAECRHLVVLSSALVYGAYPGNPIPLTEHHRRRPIPGLGYASVKTRVEEVAEAWAADTGAELAILRPTTTLSERGTSYIASALRAATVVRGDDVDAPVQFLHHDDLASAVVIVTTQRRSSIYNVAPDGWIGPEMFRSLLAESTLSWPEPVHDAYGELVRRLSPAIDPALVPYINYPWVVANDRLRAIGWTPAFSNEEAMVLGTPAPWWRSFAGRRRQELALGAAGVAGAVAVAGAGLAARWLVRGR